MADKYHLPPTRYLRLGYPEWGETDFDLTQAYDFYEQNLCTCGCGGWRPDCCGDNPGVTCSVVTAVCKGGAAIAEWQKDNPEPDGGTLLGLEWTTPENRLSVEEQERADLRAMLERNGQPVPPELA